MFLRQRACLVLIAVLQCICLCFVLMGVTGGFDSGAGDADEAVVNKKEDVKQGNFSAPVNLGDVDSQVPEKVVLVVIDALRLDFLTEENFPFLMGKLRKYRSTTRLKFDVKVDSPTVTLPRVKVIKLDSNA